MVPTIHALCFGLTGFVPWYIYTDFSARFFVHCHQSLQMTAGVVP